MTLGPRPSLGLALPAIAGALLLLAQPAGAQQEAPKPDLERAQKAADAVFHWIRLNADKGASRQPTTAPAAPAPVAKKAAPVAAAPRPPQTPAPAPAPAPAVPPSAVAAGPAPVAVAAATTAPEPEPERAPVELAAAVPLAEPAQAAEPPAQAAQEEPDEPEEPLKLLSKVNPTMPRQLQQSNFRNGIAQVQFTVGTDGSVQQASVIKASNSRLGNAAVDAVRQWRFAPLRKPREAAVEVAFKNDTE